MAVSLHYQMPGAIGISTTEGIKTHQCSMCQYLVCETTMNVREGGATPLVTLLSTLYNNR